MSPTRGARSQFVPFVVLRCSVVKTEHVTGDAIFCNRLDVDIGIFIIPGRSHAGPGRLDDSYTGRVADRPDPYTCKKKWGSAIQSYNVLFLIKRSIGSDPVFFVL